MSGCSNRGGEEGVDGFWCFFAALQCVCDAKFLGAPFYFSGGGTLVTDDVQAQ